MKTWVCAAMLALNGLGAAQTTQPVQRPPAALTVAAAASLQPVMKELSASYSEPLRLSFASSGTSVQQVLAGAPIDVLLLAEESRSERLKAAVASWVPFARNRLVIIAPAQSASHWRLADLARPATGRIAIGLPESVPAGRYAQAALEAAGLWEAVKPKLVRAQNVRQVLEYVARGEVSVGLVYATDAASDLRVRASEALEGTGPIVYTAAVVRASAGQAQAERFIAFLGSDPAQAILRKHGFLRP